MTTRARCLIGLLVAGLLIGGATALIRAGFYGLTLFVVLPVLLGGLASWVFRPATGVRAAVVGALTVLALSSLLLIVGLEGFICIAMTLPLAVPLGALGGWLVFHAQSSRLATSGVMTLLLLPPATFAWDVKAPPSTSEVRDGNRRGGHA